MMAKMTLADTGEPQRKIDERGFVTAQESVCGSGAMVIALADDPFDLAIVDGVLQLSIYCCRTNHLTAIALPCYRSPQLPVNLTRSTGRYS
jgi:hypothetical protein